MQMGENVKNYYYYNRKDKKVSYKQKFIKFTN